MSSPERPDGPEPRLSKEDRLGLQLEITSKYNTDESARQFLAQLRFPRERIPIFRSAQTFWREVFFEFDRGVIDHPYRRMLEVISRQRERDRTIVRILTRALADDTMPASAHANLHRDTCHAIVWTESGAVRQFVRQWLEVKGLDPFLVWGNAEMTSFNVNESDESQVRRKIGDERPELLFKVVPPGQPDYLLNLITVAGRDGREFPMRQVPVQLTVIDLAHSAARLHPSARSTTIGKIRNVVREGGGATHPVIPAETLLHNGFRNGDRVVISSVHFGKIKVLLIGASPQWDDDTGHGRCDLRFDEEARILSDLEGLGHLELVRTLPNAKWDDLSKIVDHRPDIIHLSCHGEGTMLILEDGQKAPYPIRADRFASRLAQWKEHNALLLSGLVLSACSGEIIGPAIYKDGAVRTVIAHRASLTDPKAIDFTRQLYDELRRTPILSSAAALAAEHVYGSGTDDDPDGKVLIIPLPPEPPEGD